MKSDLEKSHGPRQNFTEQGDQVKKDTRPGVSSSTSKLEVGGLSSFGILIVDDEAELRDAIVFDFKRKGFTVYSAENGIKAIEILKNHKIDLVISDIRMPECDGLALLERIRSTTDGKPPSLIFITGFTDVTVDECLVRGAVMVFSKPYDRKELMKCALATIGVSG